MNNRRNGGSMKHSLGKKGSELYLALLPAPTVDYPIGYALNKYII